MARAREGSVQILKDGSIWARVTYTGEDSKRHTLRRRAQTKTDAKKIIRQLLDGLERTGPRAIDGDRMRFRDLARLYAATKLKPAEYHAGRKVAGLRSWKTPRGFLNTLVAHFGNQFVKSITHDDIERFKLLRLKMPSQRGGERSIASVNRELEIMRAVMRFAQRLGYIVRSPFEMGAPLISKADESKRERTLSRDEEDRLLTACTGRRAHLRPLLICALDTAMRRGELFKLVWRDVDLTGRTITVQALNSKTARPRSVPMTPRLHAELESLWQQSPRDLSLSVFGIYDTIKRSFASACREAGVDGFRFHDCRHTAITRLIAARVPAQEVMKISGHTQMSTFLRYLNPTNDSLQRAAELLSAYNAESRTIDAAELIN